jgi:hypothetical protein
MKNILKGQKEDLSMSKIITTVDRVIYDSLYNLQSYSEKSLQRWISKYKEILYPDYYCFQSGYNFSNKKGDKSAADLILIARDFSEWKIVEVELAAKRLIHTNYQLGIFTSLNLDIESFWKHCQRKVPAFYYEYRAELKKCLSATPEVLVIFDFEDTDKIRNITEVFPQVKVGFCELYMTTRHNATIIRIFGENNYVTAASVYLRPNSPNKSMYTVSEIKFFKKIRQSRLNFVCEGKVAHLEIIKIRDSIKVKIDDHPYNEDSILILERTLSDIYYLKAVNPN